VSLDFAPAVPAERAAAPVAAPPAATPQSSVADRLVELGKLHTSGVLTDDEFTAAKKRLLGL